LGPFPAGSRHLGRLLTIADVTDRERYRMELERQNERLDEFASVVSHDLRNPLNVAQGRLELAREECNSDHLTDVRTAQDRMAELIDDLLTLARAGKRVGETEPVDLGAVADDCQQNVEMSDANVVVEAERSVRADPGPLRQLLENLLRNAAEHSEADVTITVGEMDTGFYVEDDGPGIPEADRDEVFDAGYSTTEDGTGFGLNIVKQVAEAHGWTVRVTEGSDGGARFEITSVSFVSE
jgi:signal transduction histidine kinase